MAWSEVVTEVRGNPAGRPKKKRKPMAKRNMSAKQIRFFGTKRQKAALKAKRKKVHHKVHRHKAARKATNRARPRPKAKKVHRPRTAKKRTSNPGPEMLALTLGNSARKGGGKHMARSRKKKRSSTSHRSNSPRRHSKKVMHHLKRSRNPAGLGNPMDWVTGGAGVLTGVVGTRAIPQLILGSSNTGAMGYIANGITAAGLGFLSHMFFPRNRVLTPAVVAGGFASLIARIIGDYTTYGQYLSLTGVGDYMVSNVVAPQRLVNPSGAMVEVPTGWGSSPPSLVMSSSGVDGSMSSMGVDLGTRAGVC